jgi:hypothetical protein
MGTDPATSVTDPRLRVHGIQGLRVADASSFPNLIAGNTNAPRARRRALNPRRHGPWGPPAGASSPLRRRFRGQGAPGSPDLCPSS